MIFFYFERDDIFCLIRLEIRRKLKSLIFLVLIFDSIMNLLVVFFVNICMFIYYIFKRLLEFFFKIKDRSILELLFFYLGGIILFFNKIIERRI